ncbi:MAG: DNA integrity scanning protein DisA nucleotide-binding domain protein [Actinomycetota bacterium]
MGEELDELDPRILTAADNPDALLEELAYAMRPPVHERRVPSYGVFVEPSIDIIDWTEAIGFGVSRRKVQDLPDRAVRLFANGIVSWVVRSPNGVNDLVVFDRGVGSERDLSVLSSTTDATMIQRHPVGIVRAVGPFGVLRHEGIDWQLEPPVGRWLDMGSCLHGGLKPDVLNQLLLLAVHDVAARRVGATFVIAPGGRLEPSAEVRYRTPPEFSVQRPADLAPLVHILGQLDGAAVFDETGTLRRLGVRLVPSAKAEAAVEPYRGTRHTSALRYSFDDPDATIIVISEDGPVSVLQGGHRLGRSAD